MTIDISANVPRISYTVAAGVTQTSFAVPFEFFDDSDLNVYIDQVLQTITTNYTVTGGSGSTGTVTMTVTGAKTVIITRDTTIERTTDFTAGVDINRAALNTQLDTLTAIAADNKDFIERSIRIKDFDPTTASLELPDATTRANKLLSFDTEGGISVQAASDLLTGSVLGANYTKASYTGNGSTTAYSTVEAAGSKNNIQVYIDGVYQNKDTFSISGATLTFTEAPPLNSAIEFIVGNAITSLTTDPDVVTYNQGGTGAQDRTLTSKLQDFVSVKDFGAVGDGVADDTAAINAASLEASINGFGLYFPEGTYVGKNLLVYTNSRWFGESRSSILKLSASASSGDVLVKNKNCGTNIDGSDAAVPGDNNIIFDTLTFDGNKANQTNTPSIIYWRRVQYSQILNCKIINGDGVAIDACNAIDHCLINGNLFQNNDGEDIRILWVSNRNIISDNVIIGANLPTADGGEGGSVSNPSIKISAVNVTGGANFNNAENILQGNVIKGKTIGLLLDGCFETIVSNNVFGSQTEENIKTQQTGTYACQGLNISANVITGESTTDAALLIDAARRVQISGNGVTNSSTDCLVIFTDDDNSQISVDGNTFMFGSNQGTGNGITIRDGGAIVVSNNIVIGARVGINITTPTIGQEMISNRIVGNTISNSDRNAILVTEGGASRIIKNIMISDNSITNVSLRGSNSDDAILVERSAGTLDDVYIDGNVIYDINGYCRDAIRLTGTINRKIVGENNKAYNINGVIVNGSYTSAPADSGHPIGQRVYNFAPTSGGTEGWILTSTGWKTFGAIS